MPVTQIPTQDTSEIVLAHDHYTVCAYQIPVPPLFENHRSHSENYREID